MSTILELSRKYSPKHYFRFGGITLACAFCGTGTEIGYKTLINNGQYGLLMACPEHEEDASKETFIEAASRAAMPPEIVRGLKVTSSGEEYKLIHMRVSRSLRPNEIIFLVKKTGEGYYNKFLKDLDNPEIIIKQIKENIENYDNPHYPEDMKQAFLTKLGSDLMKIEAPTLKRGSPEGSGEPSDDEQTTIKRMKMENS